MERLKKESSLVLQENSIKLEVATARQADSCKNSKIRVLACFILLDAFAVTMSLRV